MNVKIIRVLNTNAVVSVDSQGRELIMTGPGIGFKKRKGENIDQSLVDKTYHLENKEESKRLHCRESGACFCPPVHRIACREPNLQ